jgi:hypothetical protein
VIKTIIAMIKINYPNIIGIKVKKNLKVYEPVWYDYIDPFYRYTAAEFRGVLRANIHNLPTMAQMINLLDQTSVSNLLGEATLALASQETTYIVMDIRGIDWISFRNDILVLLPKIVMDACEYETGGSLIVTKEAPLSYNSFRTGYFFSYMEDVVLNEDITLSAEFTFQVKYEEQVRVLAESETRVLSEENLNTISSSWGGLEMIMDSATEIKLQQLCSCSDDRLYCFHAIKWSWYRPGFFDRPAQTFAYYVNNERPRNGKQFFDKVGNTLIALQMMCVRDIIRHPVDVGSFLKYSAKHRNALMSLVKFGGIPHVLLSLPKYQCDWTIISHFHEYACVPRGVNYLWPYYTVDFTHSELIKTKVHLISLDCGLLGVVPGLGVPPCIDCVGPSDDSVVLKLFSEYYLVPTTFDNSLNTLLKLTLVKGSTLHKYYVYAGTLNLHYYPFIDKNAEIGEMLIQHMLTREREFSLMAGSYFSGLNFSWNRNTVIDAQFVCDRDRSNLNNYECNFPFEGNQRLAMVDLSSYSRLTNAVYQSCRKDCTLWYQIGGFSYVRIRMNNRDLWKGQRARLKCYSVFRHQKGIKVNHPANLD